MAQIGTILNYFPAMGSTLIDNGNYNVDGSTYVFFNTGSTQEFAMMVDTGSPFVEGQLLPEWTFEARVLPSAVFPGDITHTTSGKFGIGIAPDPQPNSFVANFFGIVDFTNRTMFYNRQTATLKSVNIPSSFNLAVPVRLRVRYKRDYVCMTLYNGIGMVELEYAYNYSLHQGNNFGSFCLTQWDGKAVVESINISSQHEYGVKYLCVGDSTMLGRPLVDPSGCFASLFAGSSANRRFYAKVAQGGTPVIDLYNNRAFYAALQPQKILLMTGSNNPPSDPDSFFSTYTLLVKYFLETGIPVIGLTPPPANGGDYTGIRNLIMAATTSTFTSSPTNGATFTPVDVFTPLLGTGSNYNPAYTTDGVHLSRAGNVVVANTLIAQGL
jgi:hypothetical protein